MRWGGKMAETKGRIYRISGPVVTAIDLKAKMFDLVQVGEEKLLGEVIQIFSDKAVIQVYEDTTGLKPDEPVVNTNMPLSIELGPGILTQIYDGIQRPLPILAETQGHFILRGTNVPGLDRKKKWNFKAKVKSGDKVSGGMVLGNVKETETIDHKILVPPLISGTIKTIKEGSFTVDEVIGILTNGQELKLMHYWPVRKPRPSIQKLPASMPLISGQRILDTLSPLAKGGTAAIPGPFGSGKTVTQQQLAKWSDAEIVVYIGCGERGNEMTEVLTEFPELKDIRTGKPLMDRTVLIANTSNMPVAAREASVYTGMTIAEYYRDQGYNVSLMADSTSRWAEAMREISSRLEEMPGEEGYPAYLASRLAEFYERAGVVKCLGDEKRQGSITAIGAVSPAGGDFSEPVTQNTLKIVKVFWALDAKLAQARHFPAINWLDSYSLYKSALNPWFKENVAEDFPELREKTMKLLQREAELQEIVQLVGSDALPEKERLLLDTAKLIRQGFLSQNAYHDIDTYSSMKKQYQMLKLIMHLNDVNEMALSEGADINGLTSLKVKEKLVKMGFEKEVDLDKNFKGLMSEIEKETSALVKGAR